MQISIQIKTIKALLHFAAKKDIRYYLQGLHIEQGATGTYAVATNGHFLAVARIDTQAQAPASVIVGSDHLSAAIKGNKLDFITLEVVAAYKVTIKTGVSEVTVQTLDGRYPDWRRVIRAPQTGEQAYFDPDYSATVQKAAREYHGNKSLYHVAQNGNSVGHCAIDDDLQVFVMPVRAGGSNPVAPWVGTC